MSRSDKPGLLGLKPWVQECSPRLPGHLEAPASQGPQEADAGQSLRPPRLTGHSSRRQLLSRRPRGWCCRAGLASTSRAHGRHGQAGHWESSEPEVGAGLVPRLPGPPHGLAAGRAAPVALASREGRGGSKASSGPLTAQESAGQGQRPCALLGSLGAGTRYPSWGCCCGVLTWCPWGGGLGGSRAAEGRAVDRGGAWVSPGQARWPWGGFSQCLSISQAVMCR